MGTPAQQAFADAAFREDFDEARDHWTGKVVIAAFATESGYFDRD